MAVDGEGLPLNCESMVRMKLTVESQTETVSYKIQINGQQKNRSPVCLILMKDDFICIPVEVDQSFGALLMMCGLCTVPYHGEHCSMGAVRRRSVGETKGLPKSGVNGAVSETSPTVERAKTETGVFISRVGLGLIKSSEPDTTCRKKEKKRKLCLIFLTPLADSQKKATTALP